MEGHPRLGKAFWFHNTSRIARREGSQNQGLPGGCPRPPLSRRRASPHCAVLSLPSFEPLVWSRSSPGRHLDILFVLEFLCNSRAPAHPVKRTRTCTFFSLRLECAHPKQLPPPGLRSCYRAGNEIGENGAVAARYEFIRRVVGQSQVENVGVVPPFREERPCSFHIPHPVGFESAVSSTRSRIAPNAGSSSTMSASWVRSCPMRSWPSRKKTGLRRLSPRKQLSAAGSAPPPSQA